VNEFITASEPWVLAKDESKAPRLSQVLYDAAEATRIAAVLLLPVMPSSAEEILKRLGGQRKASEARLSKDALWGAAGELSVEKAPALWPRLEAKG
jgi:methionyl-tRNA synthetase